jgi:hypothetical protein
MRLHLDESSNGPGGRSAIDEPYDVRQEMSDRVSAQPQLEVCPLKVLEQVKGALTIGENVELLLQRTILQG